MFPCALQLPMQQKNFITIEIDQMQKKWLTKYSYKIYLRAAKLNV